jgi:F420-0:gamma-glutamyl ligase
MRSGTQGVALGWSQVAPLALEWIAGFQPEI